MAANFFPIKTALISVSDKTGILELAQYLTQYGIKIISTGGTASYLQENGLEVTQVSEVTQFPEIMNGRVKTLHPKIHGGILRRPGIDDDVLAQQQIEPIDLLVVNLYPFEKVIADQNTTLDTAIENIDIGGPTMIRAAAKNHQTVTVVVEPNDYQPLLQQLQQHQQQTELAFRHQLAIKGFAHTARYDTAINQYLSLRNSAGELSQPFPDFYAHQFKLQQPLRYGENPHQAGAFYQEIPTPPGTVSSSKQLQGKPLSYNNLADSDAALECVKQFTETHSCVIVKHANPCGVAAASNQLEAYQMAYQTDPTSAFGGIIAFNQALTAETAKAIIAQQFVEVVIAPEIEQKVAACFAEKPNVRLLATGQWANTNHHYYNYKRINGGLLIQDNDIRTLSAEDLKIVSKRQPTSQELEDLLFAWKVVKFVKSNAIVYCRNQQTIGIGAGQMSRVYSAKIAEIKAHAEGLTVAGSVMASDAFFPFPDTIEMAEQAGITAIIQPGGSIRDQAVIEAADKAGIAMIFTGIRHFLH